MADPAPNPLPAAAHPLRFASDLTRPLASGGTPGAAEDFNAPPLGPPSWSEGGGAHRPDAATDHRLGQQLAAWIVERGQASIGSATLLSRLQDELGADTALLLPLRDLLQRPAFRSLFSGEAASVQRGRRDALLADLAGTYAPAVLQRLALVIDGCLGLPATAAALPAATAAPGASWPAPPPGSHSQPAWMPQPAAAHPSASSHLHPDSDPSQAPSRGSGPPYAAAPAPAALVPPAPAAISLQAGGSTAASQPGGCQPLLGLLIVLVALLTGGVAGLGTILLLNRPSPSPASGARSSPPAQPRPAATSPVATAPSPEPPATAPAAAPADAIPTGAWGASGDYKFGRQPGGDYPNSCAFSRTDEAGQKTIDKSQVEFWACRDIGGDAERGYNVAWADGKQTTYTFRNDGSGAVVGTNGSSHPMNWRNDSHQGSDIIVINHQDGATTWIPGHVR